MLNQNERKLILEQGVSFEKAGEWAAAYDFWVHCTKVDPCEIRFLIRQASAALRIRKPESAIEAIVRAQRLDAKSTHSEDLENLQQRAKSLLKSMLRIQGVQAYDAGDFDSARISFETLAELDPNHPWAKYRAISASGLAPSFADRLKAELPAVKQRIFLTGCGRSGTWLFTAMLSCIEGIRIPEKEEPLGAFLEKANEPRIHLIKRLHNAFLHFDKVPNEIKIIHIVRHPFDVLISHHLDKPNYISLARLEAEHAMYFKHLAERPNTLVIKYEDMVGAPNTVQQRVEKFLHLKAARPFREFYLKAAIEDNVAKAMHGLRPLDVSTLHRWRVDNQAKDYLKALLKESDGTLQLFADAFGYDINLIE